MGRTAFVTVPFFSVLWGQMISQTARGRPSLNFTGFFAAMSVHPPSKKGAPSLDTRTRPRNRTNNVGDKTGCWRKSPLIPWSSGACFPALTSKARTNDKGIKAILGKSLHESKILIAGCEAGRGRSPTCPLNEANKISYRPRVQFGAIEDEFD